MARLRMKKRKEKHGKHAVFFFYALYAYTFSFPKNVHLEEIGALKRKSAYRLCDEQAGVPICCVQLDDQTNIRLDNEKLCKIIEKGMESCGYLQSRRVSKVLVESGN